MAAWKIKEVCCNSLNELNIFIEENNIEISQKDLFERGEKIFNINCGFLLKKTIFRLQTY